MLSLGDIFLNTLYCTVAIVLLYNDLWFCSAEISLVSGETDLFITVPSNTPDVGILGKISSNEEQIANLTASIAVYEKALASTIEVNEAVTEKFQDVQELLAEILGHLPVLEDIFHGCENITMCACASFPCESGLTCSNVDGGTMYSCTQVHTGSPTIPSPTLGSRSRQQMIDPNSYAADGVFSTQLKFGMGSAISPDGLLLAVYAFEGPYNPSTPHLCIYTRAVTSDTFAYSYCVEANLGTHNAAGEMKMTPDGTTIFISEKGWAGSMASDGRIVVMFDDGSGFVYRETIVCVGNPGTSSYFGRDGAFDFTNNGGVLAVGAHSYAAALPEGGYVDVFTSDNGYYTHQSTVVAPLELQTTLLKFGNGVALSGDGEILAVAISHGTEDEAWVIIYTDVGNTGVYDWAQTIPVFSTSGVVINFGMSMVMAKDASVIVVSEPYREVFSLVRNEDGSYNETPQRLTAAGYNGEWITMSHDGLHMAYGDRIAETIRTFYRENTSSFWIGMEAYSSVALDIQPDDVDAFGWKCSLSGDGSVLVVPAAYSSVYNVASDSVITYAGVVYVIEV